MFLKEHRYLEMVILADRFAFLKSPAYACVPDQQLSSPAHGTRR